MSCQNQDLIFHFLLNFIVMTTNLKPAISRYLSNFALPVARRHRRSSASLVMRGAIIRSHNLKGISIDGETELAERLLFSLFETHTQPHSLQRPREGVTPWHFGCWQLILSVWFISLRKTVESGALWLVLWVRFPTVSGWSEQLSYLTMLWQIISHISQNGWNGLHSTRKQRIWNSSL